MGGIASSQGVRDLAVMALGITVMALSLIAIGVPPAQLFENPHTTLGDPADLFHVSVAAPAPEVGNGTAFPAPTTKPSELVRAARLFYLPNTAATPPISSSITG